MALHRQLLHQQLLLLLIISAVRVASQSNSNCVRKCGNVEIPYPFGTSWGCYRDESFHINCNNISGTLKPFLANGSLEILNISLNDGELLVSTPLTRDCSNNHSQQSIWSKFPISDRKNKFIAVGCGIIAYVRDSSGIYASACISSCASRISSVNNSRPCSGRGCCETTVPPGVVQFTVNTMFNFGNSCVFSFVVEKKAFNFSSSDLSNLRSRSTVPVVLDWAIANKTCEDARNSTDYACRAEKSECHNSTNGSGYLCKCSSGFEGNAYDVDHGCKGTG